MVIGSQRLHPPESGGSETSPGEFPGRVFRWGWNTERASRTPSPKARDSPSTLPPGRVKSAARRRVLIWRQIGSNNRPFDYQFGEVERLEAICVEQALNGNVPYASGGTVSVPTRRWNLVVSARVVQPVAVRTDAFIVVFERNFQRFRSNAVYSTSQSGCKRSIRRCTGGAFALCRKNPAEQRSTRADWIGRNQNGESLGRRRVTAVVPPPLCHLLIRIPGHTAKPPITAQRDACPGRGIPRSMFGGRAERG